MLFSSCFVQFRSSGCWMVLICMLVSEDAVINEIRTHTQKKTEISKAIKPNGKSLNIVYLMNGLITRLTFDVANVGISIFCKLVGTRI